MKLPRFAPLTGIAFVVLLVIGFGPVGGYYARQRRQRIEDLGFLPRPSDQGGPCSRDRGCCRDLLRNVHRRPQGLPEGGGADGDFWPTVALVGGIVSVAGFCVAITVHAALVDGAHNELPGDAMIALNAIDNWDFFAFAFPLAIMLFGVAGATLKAGAALPKWLGWAALVIGILFFAGPAGFFGFLLTGIWIIIASIVMYRRTAAPAATA